MLLRNALASTRKAVPDGGADGSKVHMRAMGEDNRAIEVLDRKLRETRAIDGPVLPLRHHSVFSIARFLRKLHQKYRPSLGLHSVQYSVATASSSNMIKQAQNCVLVE